MLAKIFLIVAVAVLFLPSFLRASEGQIESSDIVYKLKEEKKFNDYVVRTYDGFNGNEFAGISYFEILKGGRTVYKETEEYRHADIGYMLDDMHSKGIDNSLIAMGRDITGKGMPNLVMSVHTGGAHCCLSFLVFEIGDNFRYLDRIDARHSIYAHFANLDGEPSLEFIGNDWAFEYWRTSFSRSPAPEVILRFRGGRYVLATDLMRKPAPTGKELTAMADEIRAAPDWNNNQTPVQLWGSMLDLIYGGNAASAWRLFDLSWKKEVPGKAEFFKEFRKRLSQSEYWREIKEMNRMQLDEQ